MRGLPSILFLQQNSIIQVWSKNDSFYLSYDPKTTLKTRFLHENAKILPYIWREGITDVIYIVLSKSVNH